MATRLPRPALRRWLPLAAACVLLALFAYLDQRLKSGPLPAFVPKDNQWICTASDLPTVWTTLSQTSAGRAIAEEVSRPLHDASLAVRRATGIRPTPGRWRVWLGSRFIGARTAEGGGFCARPGLLLRLADLVAGENTGSPQVRRYGPFFYGWREGCLIAGTSKQYVQAARTADPQRVSLPGPTAIRIHHGEPFKAELEFNAGEGLPFSATLPLEIVADSAGLLFVPSWPTPPVAVLAAADGKTLLQVLDSISRAAGLDHWWASLDPEWRRLALAGWQSEEFVKLLSAIDQGVALALFNIDLAETIPLPEVALAWQSIGASPGSSLGVALEAIPFEWGDTTGWMAPRLSDAIVPCWSREGDVSLLTSRETLMAQLAEAVDPGEPIPGNVAFQLDWAIAANQGSALANHALKLGLLPDEDDRSLATRVQPWLNLMRRLGNVQIVGVARDDAQLELTGRLAADAGS